MSAGGSTVKGPNVLIIGAGGVGVITAYSLWFKNKCNVSVVIRSDYEIVSQVGYSIDSCDYGKIENWRPHSIHKTIEDSLSSKIFYDFIVVTTKNIPDGPVASRVSTILRPILTSNTEIDPKKESNILLIQNGIDLENEIIQTYSRDELENVTLLSGIQFIGSTKIGPGKIHQLGKDRLFVGGFDSCDIKARNASQEFIEIYSNEGYNIVEFEPRVRYARWKKLLYNAAINTTTALVQLDVPRTLEFAKNKDHTEKFIYEPAMREIIAIAASEGIIIEEEFIDFFINISRNLLFKPSMCVDREKNQLMELEIILGNPIKVAEKNNVPVPTLFLLYNLLTLVQSKLKEELGLLKFDEKTLKLQSTT
ncbi:hypothetical protein Kpol_1019p17 [Vanderwaltozyma polyspora DSM 70294]|uniref:2-dehydropantoate 2-reductase n=1 Tax=Vanderwaltozyma polyspora (strain ATCC 22028 / DSM 70294 / BCRC 21397 / CBS 2163 / NBRC 10782 / NRRL Y-8283 / UCD 57-17) TaxID=436907 RepID=A7TPB0_VANPO|nr:uncharacterized protein Kpol_1019p17 [Vanderwaltozyma polyspora DSM 70294]EDO15897.1 hypothetical protein Kpol_1019p17 [Vanderwaltozyma polyspora DSM 70294]